ncbi:hypothetical protein [Thomasclavelia sp.]|uniref:hypothetical protein n=1 Tax=Thomasclavelia sp. TaxID=3025757 RepID=UPI0025EBCBF8|nr:hypothetical protein [Thomasclavelia sp.]
MKKSYKYIKSDIFRYYGTCNFFIVLVGILTSSTIRWHVMFRMASQGNKIENMIGRIFYKISFIKNKIQIDFDTQIGYGLYIAHGGPIIVNGSAKIGNNCNLSQFCTIGSNKNLAAEIGDEVYIGPNVCLVEHVKIGNYATIGAGSVVTKDIPSKATAAGNYAKVIHYNKPGRFINNKWE